MRELARGFESFGDYHLGGALIADTGLPSSAIAASSPAAWWRFDDIGGLATATDGTGAVSAGSLVAYVEDLSGHGRHLTQATELKRPAFDATGWCAFGSGDHMRAPADISTAEAFIVFSRAALQSGVCALFSEGADARYFIHLSSDEIVSVDGASTATRGGAAVGAAAYTPAALTGDNIQLPGANLLENSAMQTLSLALASTNLIRNVGRLFATTSEFTGPKDIAEILLYSGRLTTDQRAGVISELTARHGATRQVW